MVHGGPGNKMKMQIKYAYRGDMSSVDGLSSFLSDVKDGKVKAYLRSEPKPEKHILEASQSLDLASGFVFFSYINVGHFLM